MALFVLASKDGWVNIMYTGLDAVGVDQQVIRTDGRRGYCNVFLNILRQSQLLHMCAMHKLLVVHRELVTCILYLELEANLTKSLCVCHMNMG